jgi:hypothetical protein
MKESTTLVLNKIEVAEVLINEAVFLFFDRASPVITEVLTGAALDVLRPLAKREKIASPLFDNPCVPSERKGEWSKLLKIPYTFFKHANWDPDETIEYSDKGISHLLYDACYLSVTLSKRERFRSHSSPSGAPLFMSWFRLKYPQFFTPQQQIPVEFTDGINPDNFKEWVELACAFRKTPYTAGYKGIVFCPSQSAKG